MKNILIFFLAVLGHQLTHAQNGNVIVFSEYANDSIKLSWSFDNVQVYEDFLKYGITIKRQVFEQNHNILSYGDRIASEIILVEGLKPGTANDINAVPNPKAKALAQLLYDTTTNSVNLSAPKLTDAVRKEKVDKMKFFMTSFLAGQDFRLGVAAGLGYVDIADVYADYAYRYILTITDSLGNNMIYPQYINVETYHKAVYTVPEIRTESKVNNITLRWAPTDNQPFISYDIHRSLSGQNNFQKINEEPFVFMKMSGTDTKDIVYTDSVAGGINFDYKIQGKTSVGSYSPFSPVVTQRALIQPILSYPLVAGTPLPSDSNVVVTWTMPDSLNAFISHFNLYKSKDQDDNYLTVNTSPITNTLREYTDMEALPEGFYIVEAIGIDSNFYRTLPIYVQLKDTIPPAPPTDLTAKYYGKSKVVVLWAANQEADIYGYRVMIGDSKNGNYNQITSDAITTNQYTTNTDPQDSRDSTFFKVFAVDKRGNYSELSASFGLKKPNIVPPAKPALNSVKPSKKGINLTWKYSSSTDVVKHTLQRKMEGTPLWDDVLVIPNSDRELYLPTDSTEYNFKDTTELEQRPYLYRLVAENDQYTNASSDIMAVTPMTPVFTKAIISNFAIVEEVLAAGISPQVELELNKLKRAKPDQGSRFSTATGQIHNIKLSWSYHLDPTVQDFQIYRSITGGATTLFRSVSIAEAMGLDPNTQQVNITEDMGIVNLNITDKDLLTGRRYTYQVLARHKDQTTTKLSNSLTLKIVK